MLLLYNSDRQEIKYSYQNKPSREPRVYRIRKYILYVQRCFKREKKKMQK